MLAPGWDGNVREVLCVRCAFRLRAGDKNEEVGFSNKEEGNLPARRTLTHILRPGLYLSFFTSSSSSSSFFH